MQFLPLEPRSSTLWLESLDGGEAQENFYERVAEKHGTALRDEVFAGSGVALMACPPPKKTPTRQPEADE